MLSPYKKGKKRMKRLIAILLAFSLVLAFSASTYAFRAPEPGPRPGPLPYPRMPLPMPLPMPCPIKHFDTITIASVYPGNVDRDLPQQLWVDQTWFLVAVVLAQPGTTVKVEAEDTCIGSSWAKKVVEAPKPVPPPLPPPPPKKVEPPPPPPPPPPKKVEPPPPPPPPVVKPKPVLDPVPFDVNKSNINPMGAKVLDKNGVVMKEYPNMKVEIGGHTDNTGSEVTNKVISEKRAKSCKQYLVDKFGISDTRLGTKGYGSSKPIADNGTKEGRQTNRRVEFIILGY